MFDTLIIVLAAYRLTVMLVDEAGPFQVLGRIRHWTRNNWIGEGLTCYACTSVWAAALVMGVFRYADLFIVLELLALSQVVVLGTFLEDRFDEWFYPHTQPTGNEKVIVKDLPREDVLKHATTFFGYKGRD